MAHKWAHWLCHPYRLGGSERLRARDKISIGPHVGALATSPLQPGRSPTKGGGGGGGWSPRLAKNAGKCGENAENAAKNAIENAVFLEWCLPLETPMFRLVLHNRALKAWIV